MLKSYIFPLQMYDTKFKRNKRIEWTFSRGENFCPTSPAPSPQATIISTLHINPKQVWAYIYILWEFHQGWGLKMDMEEMEISHKDVRERGTKGAWQRWSWEQCTEWAESWKRPGVSQWQDPSRVQDVPGEQQEIHLDDLSRVGPDYGRPMHYECCNITR